MKKFGAAALTFLVAAAIIGLWRYSARDVVGRGHELTLVVDENALPSFAPEQLRAADGPLLYLLASPLKFAHLPSALSLAEDLTLNETSRTLRIVFRKDLISPAGMPLTAKTYGEALARNRARLGASGPAGYLEGLEGAHEDYPSGIIVGADGNALTLRYTKLPQPASRLMEFAQRAESFFVPESNWNTEGWKNPEIIDSIGPWKIRSTTRDSLMLVPAGLPGYMTKFERIQIKRLAHDKMKELPVDQPLIVFAERDPEIPGLVSKGPRLWGNKYIEPTAETGDHALLQLVTDMQAYAPAAAAGD